MTATSTFTAPTARPSARTSESKSLWRTGGLAGVSAAVATSAVAAVGNALDVSLDVGGKAIPVVGFAQVTLVATLIGTIMAVVMSHRASRPRRTFAVTTLALTAISIVPDVLADAHTSTRFLLALTHVVAAAIVIPSIASRLTD
jgi:peptidoglycan/LPS O-acetylase OafA/YrhL